MSHDPGFVWRPRSKTTRVILHDSHTPADVPSVANLMLAKGRTMGLLSVGYHFIIERSGLRVSCRPEYAIGSHCPGHNHDSIGVCPAGGHAGDFGPSQLATLQSLYVALQHKYGPGLKLLGHSEVHRNRKHRCPNLDMRQLREWLNEPTDMTEHDYKQNTTQNKLIMDYLEAGRTLTNATAMVHLGIGSLTSRIAELRNEGHRIVGEWRRGVIRNERYMAYRMAAEGEKAEDVSEEVA